MKRFALLLAFLALLAACAPRTLAPEARFWAGRSGGWSLAHQPFSWA